MYANFFLYFYNLLFVSSWIVTSWSQGIALSHGLFVTVLLVISIVQIVATWFCPRTVWSLLWTATRLDSPQQTVNTDVETWAHIWEEERQRVRMRGCGRRCEIKKSECAVPFASCYRFLSTHHAKMAFAAGCAHCSGWS
jgi:hypothetical protein